MLALAQDVVTLTAGVDLNSPESVAKVLLDAVMNKQWGILVSLLISVIVAGIRKGAPENSKLGAWLKTKLGGVVANLVTSLGLAFFTLFMSGEAFSVALVVKAVSISLGAAGGWAVWKNLSEAVAEKKAQDAGAAAAAAPTDILNR